MTRAYVVGAGLAGLSAALRLAEAGRAVTLLEAAPQAGGRCRSYFDRQLDCVLDNGNHLLLSGNREALAYLRAIGAEDTLIRPERALMPFLDLEDGQRWLVEPSPGRIPWWLFSAGGRVPGTSLADWLEARRLMSAGREATVAGTIRRRGQLWRRFWQPLTVAALNTQPEEASARLLWSVVRQSFLKGADFCRPMIAGESLAATFVEPALARLAALGAEVRLGRRLRALERGGDRVAALVLEGERIALEDADETILAVSPWVAADLLPELGLAFEPRPIVNAHLLLPDAPRLPAAVPLLGLIGGTAEWLFARDRLVSLTVSAAEALRDLEPEALKTRLWRDTAKALSLPPEPRPPIRLIVEKRATFAATPAAAAARPGPVTRWRNLRLAGDYTATDLPATIEGAIFSGRRAAETLTAPA